jgi:hypothetical protein
MLLHFVAIVSTYYQKIQIIWVEIWSEKNYEYYLCILTHDLLRPSLLSYHGWIKSLDF